MFLLLGFSVCADPLPTQPDPAPFHFEAFSDPNWTTRWVVSPLVNVTGQWELRETVEPQAIPGEKMLFATTSNAYYGLSTQFEAPLDLTNETLVIQYETRFQYGIECGATYIKLFGRDNFNPTELCNETRYIIMFGADLCSETNKVHFIFRHKNPINGSFEEKHMNDAPQVKNDTISHLYTLIVRPDNSFEILIDAVSAKKGNLMTDFTPSVNAPKEVDDPTDVKPSDWVDDEEIEDPNAQRPEDWDEDQPQYVPDPDHLKPPADWLPDEPKMIPDPDAQRPDDWDDDIHGEWEAPTVPNPKCEEVSGCGEYEPPLIENELYQGKWTVPKIPNPAYKGPWKPRQIQNPHYYEDPHPHNFPELIGAGFELWLVTKDIGIGNVYIGTNEAAVRKWNTENFIPKHKVQVAAQRKKDQDTKAATAPVRSDRGGTGDRVEFSTAFGTFLETVKEAWAVMKADNPQASFIVTFVVVIVPIVVIMFACTPARQPRPKKRTPEEEAARKERIKKKKAERARMNMAAKTEPTPETKT
jgi:calnexin